MTKRPTTRLDLVMARTVTVAVLVGILAALLAKGLMLAIQLAESALHPVPLHELSRRVGPGVARLSGWDALSLCVGGLAIGVMTRYLMPSRAPRGLSHVIEDVHFHRGHTPLREGLAVGLLSATSIGAGASVGRYGPAVHLGAAAASGLGSFLRLQDQERLTLSCAGIAAAIAASFSAPLAAVIFVQEVILRQWRLYQFIPVAAAAVTGSELARHLNAQFTIPSGVVPNTVSPYEWVFFAVIGLACGGLSVAFNIALPKASAVAARIRIDDRLKPALGGLSLVAIGFLYPAVLGQGVVETQQAIAGSLALKLCLILLALKFVASVISLASGFTGGVFGPALYMGAMLGAAVGAAVEGVGIPITSLSLYAIAGMGAMVAGVVGAVFSAIMALIEMTGKLSPSLPLLFSVTCTYLVIYLGSQSSLLVRQLTARGRNPFVEIHARDPKYVGRD